MRTHRPIAILAFLLSSCSALHPSPTEQERRALAPTGQLRVALILGAPANVIRDPVTGEMKGVGHDLGRELARRIRTGFEPVLYPSVGALLAAAKTGAWDVTFNGMTADRSGYLDFTPAHLEIEFGYLVPPNSAISALGAVDRTGIRVAVPEKGAADVLLSATLGQATIVRAAGLEGCLDLIRTGKADAFAANKANLFEIADQFPGSRVLDGRFGSEQQGMLMPKGREAAAPYARHFIEQVKAEGAVKAAIDRVRMRGGVVAP